MVLIENHPLFISNGNNSHSHQETQIFCNLTPTAKMVKVLGWALHILHIKLNKTNEGNTRF